MITTKNMIEEWKPISGLDGLYEVSSYGRIKNARNQRILTPKTLPNGYQRVKLTAINGKRDKYVHRLVAEAFCVHPDGYDVVNHIDSNKANNCACNLEWTTQRGNVLHAMKKGRVSGFPNARMIVGIKDGIEYFFRSSHEAAQRIGCDHKTILKCCETGRKTRDGYYWKVVA